MQKISRIPLLSGRISGEFQENLPITPNEDIMKKGVFQVGKNQ
jgi:hypothetical protein